MGGRGNGVKHGEVIYILGNLEHRHTCCWLATALAVGIRGVWMKKDERLFCFVWVYRIKPG